MTSSQVKLSRQIPRSFVVEMLAENWQQGGGVSLGPSQHSALNAQKSANFQLIFNGNLMPFQISFGGTALSATGGEKFENGDFSLSIQREVLLSIETNHSFTELLMHQYLSSICALCLARPGRQLFTWATPTHVANKARRIADLSKGVTFTHWTLELAGSGSSEQLKKDLV